MSQHSWEALTLPDLILFQQNSQYAGLWHDQIKIVTSVGCCVPLIPASRVDVIAGTMTILTEVVRGTVHCSAGTCAQLA